jgi:hypothetical protein
MAELTGAARAEASHLDDRPVDLAVHQTDEVLVRADGGGVGPGWGCDGRQQRCGGYGDQGQFAVHRDLRTTGVRASRRATADIIKLRIVARQCIGIRIANAARR